MEEKGISDGDSIFILGFPQIFKNHREEEIKKLITRHGTIANIKELYSAVKPENIKNLFSILKPEFIVDSLVYPGNSGGPVILDPRLNHDLDLKDVQEPLIIRMVANYYSHREKALSERWPNEQKVLFEDNSGLASVYPLNFVYEIAEYAENKLDQHIKNLAQLIKEINSKKDLKEYFLDSYKEFIKSEIESKLKRITSNEAIKLINGDIDKNKQLNALLIEHFMKYNFEEGINNFRNTFEYEFIEEFIPKEESKKILKLLDEWDESERQ